MPFQSPERINDALLAVLKSAAHLRLEIGVNVNHPVEFWPESREALVKIRATGGISQSAPLLKGVNDDLETLSALYTALRDNDIEAHFHVPRHSDAGHAPSPNLGTEGRGTDDAAQLFGRILRPEQTHCLMTDIGKIVRYDGAIIDRRPADNTILLRSGYRAADRKKWNPELAHPQQRRK